MRASGRPRSLPRLTRVLCRYGGGAMIAAPLFQHLLNYFGRTPEYLGAKDAVELINQGGKLFAEVRQPVLCARMPSVHPSCW